MTITPVLVGVRAKPGSEFALRRSLTFFSFLSTEIQNGNTKSRISSIWRLVRLFFVIKIIFKCSNLARIEHEYQKFKKPQENRKIEGKKLRLVPLGKQARYKMPML